MHGIGIRSGMDSNGCHTQLLSGAMDTQGDFPTVGNQKFGNHASNLNKMFGTLS
jgi:hypothetical protein